MSNSRFMGIMVMVMQFGSTLNLMQGMIVPEICLVSLCSKPILSYSCKMMTCSESIQQLYVGGMEGKVTSC